MTANRRNGIAPVPDKPSPPPEPGTAAPHTSETPEDVRESSRERAGGPPVPPPEEDPRIEAESSDISGLGASGAPLARINPVRIAGGNGAESGPDQAAQIQRLSEVMAQTRRQLKTLYEHLQESRGATVLAEELLEELRQVKTRLAQLEHRFEGIGHGDLLHRADLSGAQVALDDEPPGLPQNPLADAPAGESRREPQVIDRFLRLMVERGASDMHLSVGCPPMYRDTGDIEPLRYRRLRREDWTRLLEPITPTPVWRTYLETGDADFAYEIGGIGRFRVNLFLQERGGAAVFRVIPTKILTIDQLALPPQVHRLARIASGLVLVTGPTGSGKSTTLAAIADAINQSRADHIVTLEDPIEFVHANKRSIFHQREIGTHCCDFATGLKDAVREDPNLLMVGEMRDTETIRLALESAEKGLLVFGTLHTNNAAKTVDRIVNTFPADEQETIRSILADTIRAILAQQLLKRVGGGRIAAVELLFGSPALANLIRDGKTHQITSLIQTGRRQGMVAMDESLKQLLDQGVIARQAAFEKAIDKSLFRDPDRARLEDDALREAHN